MSEARWKAANTADTAPTDLPLQTSGDLMDGDEPPDLGYVFCDPCLDRACANCIGLTHTRPFCGHRCGYLETIPEGDQ